MKSGFGWTLLSREALKRAETQLRDDIEGVRDEVGFLALHQAYADRFFPGTSVLHTRLRYALFVPWIYQRLIDCQEVRRIDLQLEREELVLAGRLKESGEDGVIGGHSYPEPSVQPPSMVYWTALAKWRILRPAPNGEYPGRAIVHRSIARRRAAIRLHDDDHELLDEKAALFASLPSPPPVWGNPSEPLDFKLQNNERRFLEGSLLAVNRPGEQGTPSLLARLVAAELTKATDLYSLKVWRHADASDLAALQRAGQAAALAAVGRAVYAALVEAMRETEDQIPTDNRHRANLDEVVEQFRERALALDIEAMATDATGLPESILSVLKETQLWLKRGRLPIDGLYGSYSAAEIRRKGRRSRLAKTVVGREKRAEWRPEDHPLATPLHYRWANVRRLLIDLQGAS